MRHQAEGEYVLILSRIPKSYPLTEADRRVIIAAKLYQREHRVGIPWRVLMQQTGLTEAQLQNTIHKLWLCKYMLSSPKPGSTIATERGVAAALTPPK